MSAVRRNLCLSAAGLLLLGVHEAGAHHSAAQFDTRTEVVLEGTVTQFDWRNPHVYTAIEVETDEGERYIQEIEAGASSILLPLGLSPDAVDIGDRISVIAAPNRRGERRIVLGRQMTKADGTVLPLNIAAPSARAPSVAQAESLEGTWFAPRPGLWRTARRKPRLGAHGGSRGAHCRKCRQARRAFGVHTGNFANAHGIPGLEDRRSH